jgi:hypothetical protein
MPSHYDATKKCRVGTMDEAQFYDECDKSNGAYFRGLMATWTDAGGALKWGAGGVGLRGPIEGKEVGVCFLAPAFAGKQDRIELACAGLAKQIGDARCKKLQDELRQAAGERVAGNTMISIIQPGALSPAQQKALTKVFVGLLQRAKK